MAMSVNTEGRLVFPLRTVLKNLHGYWDELGVGSTLASGRTPGVFTIKPKRWALFSMTGEVTVAADGPKATRVRIRGQLILPGNFSLPFGMGNKFAESVIRKAIDNGNQYLAQLDEHQVEAVA